MNIAYVISAYKYPDQLVRLVQRLRTPSTTFFVHVDRKTGDAIFQCMAAGLSQIPNAHLLPRHRCTWGGFGHVAASLKGIAAAINSGTAFDYMILLTGQDYPIKSNEEIASFFNNHAGREFLDHFPLPTEHWDDGGLDRIENWHIRLFGRHLRFPGRIRLPLRRAFPAGLRPFGGSSYWCLTHACIAYIHQFATQHKEAVNFFRFADVPDELIFQTILLNSTYSESITNDDLRHIVWRDPGAGSPSILTVRDFPELERSSKLFARKFDIHADSAVLEMIDEEILHFRPSTADARDTPYVE